MKIRLRVNKYQDIDEAIGLSNVIFEPSLEEIQRYHNRDDWLKKINNGGLLVTAWYGKKMVGYSYCFPERPKLHISSVGVLKEYRRLGIWKMMHEEIVKFGIKNSFKNLTLNTHKEQFPEIYAFCVSNGYEEYKTDGKKSFFIKAT